MIAESGDDMYTRQLAMLDRVIKRIEEAQESGRYTGRNAQVISQALAKYKKLRKEAQE